MASRRTRARRGRGDDSDGSGAGVGGDAGGVGRGSPSVRGGRRSAGSASRAAAARQRLDSEREGYVSYVRGWLERKVACLEAAGDPGTTRQRTMRTKTLNRFRGALEALPEIRMNMGQWRATGKRSFREEQFRGPLRLLAREAKALNTDFVTHAIKEGPSRGYVPQRRSGPHAILVALRQLEREHPDPDGYTKQDIVTYIRMHNLSSFPMEDRGGGPAGFQKGAWNKKILQQKGLIWVQSNSRDVQRFGRFGGARDRHGLTDEGRSVLEDMEDGHGAGAPYVRSAHEDRHVADMTAPWSAMPPRSRATAASMLSRSPRRRPPRDIGFAPGSAPARYAQVVATLASMVSVDLNGRFDTAEQGSAVAAEMGSLAMVTNDHLAPVHAPVSCPSRQQWVERMQKVQDSASRAAAKPPSPAPSATKRRRSASPLRSPLPPRERAVHLDGDSGPRCVADAPARAGFVDLTADGSQVGDLFGGSAPISVVDLTRESQPHSPLSASDDDRLSESVSGLDDDGQPAAAAEPAVAGAAVFANAGIVDSALAEAGRLQREFGAAAMAELSDNDAGVAVVPVSDVTDLSVLIDSTERLNNYGRNAIFADRGGASADGRFLMADEVKGALGRAFDGTRACPPLVAEDLKVGDYAWGVYVAGKQERLSILAVERKTMTNLSTTSREIPHMRRQLVDMRRHAYQCQVLMMEGDISKMGADVRAREAYRQPRLGRAAQSGPGGPDARDARSGNEAMLIKNVEFAFVVLWNSIRVCVLEGATMLMTSSLKNSAIYLAQATRMIKHLAIDQGIHSKPSDKLLALPFAGYATVEDRDIVGSQQVLASAWWQSASVPERCKDLCREVNVELLSPAPLKRVEDEIADVVKLGAWFDKCLVVPLAANVRSKSHLVVLLISSDQLFQALAETLSCCGVLSVDADKPSVPDALAVSEQFGPALAARCAALAGCSSASVAVAVVADRGAPRTADREYEVFASCGIKVCAPPGLSSVVDLDQFLLLNLTALQVRSHISVFFPAASTGRRLEFSTMVALSIIQAGAVRTEAQAAKDALEVARAAEALEQAGGVGGRGRQSHASVAGAVAPASAAVPARPSQHDDMFSLGLSDSDSDDTVAVQ